MKSVRSNTMPGRLEHMRGIADSILPTRRDLVELALDIRRSLEAAWSSDTAHHSVHYAAARTASTGQCYVSSMAYVWELQRRWPAIEAVIHRGSLRHRGVSLISDHGWVEIGTGQRRTLVDLTVDQAVDGIELVAIAASDLVALGYDYSTRDRRTLREVTNEDVWARFFILHSFLEDGVDVDAWRSSVSA